MLQSQRAKKRTAKLKIEQGDGGATSNFIQRHFLLRKCNRYVKVDLAEEKQKCGQLCDTDCVCGHSLEWHQDEGLIPADQSTTRFASVDILRQRARDEDEYSDNLRTWSVSGDTEFYFCNTFGECEFVAGRNVDSKSIAHGASAKFLRLQGVLHDTSYNEALYKLMTEMWKIPKPQLIIEVTGSAQDLPHIDHDVIQAFNQGLIQATRNARAWLVTGGTHCGVMKLVGEAVSKHHMSHDQRVTCLGIASWGIIQDREYLIHESNTSSQKPMKYKVNRDPGGYSPLDPGHNYFLLVDNGKEKRFGEEIQFRAQFTSYLTTKVKNMSGTSAETQLPIVLLVIGGGINTLTTVEVSVGGDSMERLKRPVIVVPGFGGAADLLACAYEASATSIDNNEFSKSNCDGAFEECIKNHPALTRLLGGRSSSPAAVKQTVDTLRRCLKDRKLITVVDIFDASNKKDPLDTAILAAIFKAKVNDIKSLMSLFTLAQQWNQVDIAKFILKRSFENQHTILREFIDPVKCMTKAIQRGQSGFFKLLIEYNVVDLDKYFTREMMLDHYADIFITRRVKASRNVTSFFSSILLKHTLVDKLAEESAKSKKYLARKIGDSLSKILGFVMLNPFQEHWMLRKFYKKDHFNLQSQSSTHHQHHPRSLQTGSVRNKLPRRSSHFREFVESTPFLRSAVNYPTKMRDLFMFCLLLKRSKFAEVIWRDSTEQLSTALMGSIYLKKLGDRAARLDMHDLAEDYRNAGETWKNRAINMLNKCDEMKPDQVCSMLTRSLQTWQGKTVLELAFFGKQKALIAQTAVQTKLNQVWHGRIATFTSTFLICSIALFPLLWPLAVKVQFIPESNLPGFHELVDDDDDDNDENGDATTVASSSAEIKEVDGNEDESGREESQQMLQSSLQYAEECSEDDDDGIPFNNEPILLEPVLFRPCRDGGHQMNKSTISIFTALKLIYNAPMLAMIFFLLLFTYFILTPYTMPISIVEISIWIWSFTLFLDETHSHFCHYKDLTFKEMLRSGMLDSSGIGTLSAGILMALAIFCRMCLPSESYDLPHTIYALSCLVFWVNSLRIFHVVEVLGPQVITIFKLFQELLFFLVIYVILLFAFSVSIHALLEPGDDIKSLGDFFGILIGVIYSRWWYLAGVGLDDSREEVEGYVKDSNNGSLSFQTSSLNATLLKNLSMPHSSVSLSHAFLLPGHPKHANIVATLLLIVYLFLTNILLLNMLIALLSMKVEQVRSDSFILWRFTNYRVVTTYYNKLLLPPPFNMFRIVYILCKRLIKRRKPSQEKWTNLKIYLDPASPEYTKLNLIEQGAMAEVLQEEVAANN